MANRLSGKRIVITGAANNIGKEAAMQFVREGASVAIGDIDEKLGQATADELGAHFFKVDVTVESSVKDFIEAAVKALGGLDVLVQNAGLQRSGSVTEFSAKDWDALFAVNTRAHFFGVKYAIPHLRKSGKGSIIHLIACGSARWAWADCLLRVEGRSDCIRHRARDGVGSGQHPSQHGLPRVG